MKNQIERLTPEFISGFVDSDGCFCIIREKRGSPKGFLYRLTFYITQQSPKGMGKSNLLQGCAAYFQGGNWVHDKRTNCYSLRIQSLKLLLVRVLPHFSAYPLLSEKAQDLQLFREGCLLLQEGVSGLQRDARLEAIALSMNSRGNRYSKGNCPGVGGGSIPQLHPQYVSGFIQGDGGFHFSFRRNPHRARPTFACGQHVYSRPLLEALQQFFSAGHIYQVKERHWRWSVDSVEEIREQICPHFKKYPLFDERAKMLHLFCAGVDSLGAKGLSPRERLIQLVDLLYDSNMGGKRRHLKKVDYLRECKGTLF